MNDFFTHIYYNRKIHQDQTMFFIPLIVRSKYTVYLCFLPTLDIKGNNLRWDLAHFHIIHLGIYIN